MKGEKWGLEKMIICFIIIIPIIMGVLAVYLNAKPGRIIPLFFLSIIVILYIFGLFGMLQFGMYFVLICIFITCSMAVLVVIRSGCNKRELAKKSLSFSVITYVLVCCFLSWLDKGMLCCNWDEFSHWADVTKAMTYINDFSTSQLSHSMFQSYPPGMSLLQYFFEKIKMMGGSAFSEDLLFFVYQVCLLSMMLPFMENDKLSRFGKITMTVSTCVLPIIFFSNFYTLIYIDPYVAMLSAFGMTLIAFSNDKDIIYDITVDLIIINLLLAKDIGMYFGLFISIMYAIEKLHSKNIIPKFKLNKNIVKNIVISITPIFLMILTKLSWNHNINVRNAKKSFSNVVDIREFLRMFFVGDVESYRQTVVNSARKELFNPAFELNGFNASYFSIFVAVVFAVFTITIIKISKKDEAGNCMGIVCITPIISVALYMMTIGAIYAYKFSEYEATGLASFSRYMNIPFMALSLYLLWGGYCVLSNDLEKRTIVYGGILCIVLVITPLTPFHNTLTGSAKKYAKNFRNSYTSLVAKIQKQCDTDDKIWIISRGDRGLNYWVLRYSSRPIWITEGEGEWNLGKAVNDEPEYVDISAEEWISRLVDGRYTHVAIYNADDVFVDDFGSAFEDASKIENNTLFYLDYNRRILVLCEE